MLAGLTVCIQIFKSFHILDNPQTSISCSTLGKAIGISDILKEVSNLVLKAAEIVIKYWTHLFQYLITPVIREGAGRVVS